MSEFPAPAALVPQVGSMCLLDAVGAWDENRVSCTSASHRRADNPLRRDGILGTVHLLEYAAQAAAVHGALTARGEGERAPTKYLVAARDFALHVTHLDDLRADLSIDAELLLVMGNGAMYGFRVSADGWLLAEGRLSVSPPEARSS